MGVEAHFGFAVCVSQLRLIDLLSDVPSGDLTNFSAQEATTALTSVFPEETLVTSEVHPVRLSRWYLV